MDLKIAIAANEEYHATDGTSSTEIATFLEDRLKWYEIYKLGTRAKDPPTAAMRLGTFVHLMCELGGPEHVSATVPENLEIPSEKELLQLREGFNVVEPTPTECPAELVGMFRDDGTINRSKKVYQTWKKAREAEAGEKAKTLRIWTKGEWFATTRGAAFANTHHGKWLFKHGEANPLIPIWERLKENSEAEAWLLVDPEYREKELRWGDPTIGKCRCKIDVIDNDQDFPCFVDWKYDARDRAA